nr:Chain D, Taperin [Homo sapiens]
GLPVTFIDEVDSEEAPQ